MATEGVNIHRQKPQPEYLYDLTYQDLSWRLHGEQRCPLPVKHPVLSAANPSGSHVRSGSAADLTCHKRHPRSQMLFTCGRALRSAVVRQTTTNVVGLATVAVSVVI